MEEKVEIPKTGVTFSYGRFLSDSAAGYTILLLLLLAYKNGYPVFGMNLKDFIGVGISQELAVFILLLFFFLSTPLGLIINAFSWFLLGWLQEWGHTCMVEWNIFIKETKESHLFDNWNDAFGMDKAHWYVNSELMLGTLSVYYPHIIEQYNHVEGIKIFSRNIILLSLFCMLNSVINVVICSHFGFGAFLKSSMVCIGFGLFFFFLNAMLSFYRSSGFLSKIYILCFKLDPNYINDLKNINFDQRINKVRELLTQNAKL